MPSLCRLGNLPVNPEIAPVQQELNSVISAVSSITSTAMRSFSKAEQFIERKGMNSNCLLSCAAFSVSSIIACSLPLVIISIGSFGFLYLSSKKNDLPEILLPVEEEPAETCTISGASIPTQHLLTMRDITFDARYLLFELMLHDTLTVPSTSFHMNDEEIELLCNKFFINTGALKNIFDLSLFDETTPPIQKISYRLESLKQMIENNGDAMEAFLDISYKFPGLQEHADALLDDELADEGECCPLSCCSIEKIPHEYSIKLNGAWMDARHLIISIASDKENKDPFNQIPIEQETLSILCNNYFKIDPEQFNLSKITAEEKAHYIQQITFQADNIADIYDEAEALERSQAADQERSESQCTARRMEFLKLLPPDILNSFLSCGSFPGIVDSDQYLKSVLLDLIEGHNQADQINRVPIESIIFALWLFR
jgi:hypothetical protein